MIFHGNMSQNRQFLWKVYFSSCKYTAFFDVLSIHGINLLFPPAFLNNFAYF